MKPKFKIKNLKLKINNGFTLVEIILYMTLVSIFILTLTDIFTAILDVKTESEATSSVEQDGRFILARMAYDIHGIPANWTVNPPNALGDTSNSLRWILTSPCCFSATYSLNNGNLQLAYPAGFGTYNLNSSETTVSNLSFTKRGNTGGKETITAQFTITSKTQRPQGPETRTFNTTIERR